MNKQSAWLILFLIIGSCSKQNINGDPIMDVPVNLTINMSLPGYMHLLNQGTFAFESGGVKGIIIVHHTDDMFYAFDRACSFRPSDSCANIEVDSSLFLFRCGKTTSGGFVKCCDSKFTMNGEVFNAPATFGLKHYQVVRSGNLLSIKN